jgi:7-keto-8-aminopelargonate synthetase-like enzyme
LTGRILPLINLSSYNYLGFAQGEGPCAEAVLENLDTEPVAVGGTRVEGGTLPLHRQLEQLVAAFLGVEDTMVVSMGFATNSLVIPSIAGPGCLLLSDTLNHSSLVFGCRLSGATIKVFKHNDLRDLERLLREQIVAGQPRTHRPWRHIWVIAEGLYSMEGDILRVRPLLALKRKYKFSLYIDEAHSIGALGPKGRGVCDLWAVDPRQVDILMGTFTKSFGASGGYLAGRRDLIEHLRRHTIAYHYSEPMSPSICLQVLTSMQIIMGQLAVPSPHALQKDSKKMDDRMGDEMRENSMARKLLLQSIQAGEGQRRLGQIHDNSVYFQHRLKDMGFVVLGDEGSPVVPILIINPGKIAAFSREAMLRGLAVVVVGFPATGIIESRVRFCISAAHTRQDLDNALEQISEIGDIMRLKYLHQWLF